MPSSFACKVAINKSAAERRLMTGIVQHQLGVAEAVVQLAFVVAKADERRRAGSDERAWCNALVRAVGETGAAAGIGDLLEERLRGGEQSKKQKRRFHCRALKSSSARRAMRLFGLRSSRRCITSRALSFRPSLI